MSPSRRRSKPAPDGERAPTLGATTVLPINAVIPYWRNPRRIPEDAVSAVKASIERFGYMQPIVVDSSNCIIIGHTRYAAMRRMGVTEVPVTVVTDLTPEQIKGLRVLDNRSAEYTSWNFEDLVAELGDLDADLMRAYFPEIGALAVDDPTQEPEPTPVEAMWNEVDTKAEFTCPECFHTWEMEVTVDAIRTGRLEVQA